MRSQTYPPKFRIYPALELQNLATYPGTKEENWASYTSVARDVSSYALTGRFTTAGGKGEQICCAVTPKAAVAGCGSGAKR
eukprot:743284-Rhodomonas_salina.1